VALAAALMSARRRVLYAREPPVTTTTLPSTEKSVSSGVRAAIVARETALAALVVRGAAVSTVDEAYELQSD
jgi:hypothetical protein